MINPIKPNTGLWISLNTNYHYYSPEALKRHCRCNHTRVLLCRIFCANHATSTAIHMENETPFPVHSCVNPHEWKQLYESEYNSHKSEIVPTTNSIFDTEPSTLLIANWFHQNILTTKHIKINRLPTDWWLVTIRFCGSLWRFCDCAVTIKLRTITSVMPICNVDRVRTIQCSVQLTAARVRHHLHLK